MKGKIVADWSKVNWRNREHRLKVYGAIQHYFDQTGINLVQKFNLQHYANASDFPAQVLSILRTYQALDNFDIAWQSIFDVVDFTGTKESGFEILDVEDGLAFNLVKFGDKAKIYKFGGQKVSVPFELYGAGLGWSKTLFDDGKYWNAEKTAISFRNAWERDKAAAHYQLIEAVANTHDIAWQAVSGNVPDTNENYLAIRDMNTINKACVDIITSLKNTGITVTENTQFTILAPLTMKPRIERALGLLNSNISGGQKGIVYNVVARYTMMLSVSTKYYVCLPKEKIISGNRMNLTVYEAFDEQTYSNTAVGWGRFGAAIGDIRQIRRCATS